MADDKRPGAADRLRLGRHRGKWALRIDGKRLSTGVDARAEYRDLAERAAREILRAKAAAAPADTIPAIIDAYLADMPLRANPKTPGDGALYAAAAVKRFFAGAPATGATRAECRAYVAARRAEGRADGTIRKELGLLAAALRWRGLDPEIDMPAPPAPRDRWLTRAEVAKILADQALPAHLRSFIHIALATGARAEAIRELRWSQNIDIDARRIWPSAKIGGKRRAKAVPMTEACAKWLTEAAAIAQTDFVIEWAGAPVRSLKTALKSAYARAGIKGVDAPAHVFRHTAGAWMAIDGVDMLEISRRLGHSSISVTERHYAHLHPDYMQASTAALEL